MTVFEFRRAIEDSMPWWVPFVLAIAFPVVMALVAQEQGGIGNPRPHGNQRGEHDHAKEVSSMENAIPIIGHAVSLAVNISLAIPFWICWTCCGIGESFFPSLPDRWRAIGFWNCVGLFMVASILKAVLVPKLASVNQSTKE